MGIQTSGQGTGTGSGAIRCPDCGGLNPPGADWCGQCLRSFAPPPPPPPPPPPAPVALVEFRHGETAIDEYFSGVSEPIGPAGDSLHYTSGGHPFDFDPLGIESDEALAAVEQEHVAPVVPLADHARTLERQSAPGTTWACRMCETPNPLAADICEVCGSSFADTMRPPGPQVTGDPNQAALYSLFWPGAGHAYLGQWGQAVARGIMSAWVLVVTAFLLFGAAGGGIVKVFALFFGLAATALWLVAAHDAHREASGQHSMVILQGRRYLYVTGTLMGLLFLMLVAAATAAS